MKPDHRHPLDRPAIDHLWIAAAARIGFHVERTGDAYASTDGRGVIQIGARETLDGDDSLAQLVFHELCHALVEGERGRGQPDWGLDNTSLRDLVREHACLRLQAQLADEEALRPLMTPTTSSRAYYLALPPFPLAGEDPAAVLARAGSRWAAVVGWHEAIASALRQTAVEVREAGAWSWSADGAPALHPLGMAPGPDDQRCGGCAWRYQDERGGSRCRRAAPPGATGPRVDPGYPACERWEPPLDCQECAACCREGFDSVAVGLREPVAWRHPELVVRRGPRFSLQRSGGCCAALAGGGSPSRYRCTIYPDRPRSCQELAPGSGKCLAARRAVGLTP